MPDSRKDFGRRGEELAAAFFLARGFRVVERNWRCRLGEIDLIIERRGRIHFVEVKTRYGLTYGYPEQALTPAKLRHFKHAIELWLRGRPDLTVYQADALTILVEAGREPDIRWIEHVL